MPLAFIWLFLASSSFAAAQSQSNVFHAVPLHFSQDKQHYIASVNMSIGDDSQRFGFAITASTGYTLVADVTCTTCASNNISTYNISQSTTATPIGSGQQQQNVSVLGGVVTATGILSKENCSLHQANGSYWNYPNQTIVRSNSSTVFQGGVSGLIRLGTDAPFGDTVGGGWLVLNPMQQNFTFGLALNPHPVSDNQNIVPDTSDPAGMLHILQPDPSSFTGDIRWQTAQVARIGNGMTDSPDSTSSDSSWVIQMDGWNFRTGDTRTDNMEGSQAAIEPFFSGIFMPNAQALQIYASVKGVEAIQRASSDFTQSYSIPCDTDMTLSIMVGGQEYSVPKEALVVHNSDGSCVGAIEGWDAPNYLLGSRFISTVYLVFQVGRDTQPQVGFARRAQMKQSHVAEIVGGTVGGVTFVLVVVVVFWAVWRWRTQSAPAPQHHRTGKKKARGMSINIHRTHQIEPWSPGLYSPTSASTLRPGAGPELYYTWTGTTSTNYAPSDNYPLVSPTAVTLNGGFNSPLASPSFASIPDTGGLQVNKPLPKIKQSVRDTRPTMRGQMSSTMPTYYDYGDHGGPGRHL